TMIPDRNETLGDLTNVILHESVHTTVYLNDQSYFNESLAEFVADRLTQDYLEKNYGRNSPELLAYQSSERESKQLQVILHQGYLDLEKVYLSSLSNDQKLARKKEILERLAHETKSKREINNATLIQYKTYHSGTEAFQKLWEKSQKQWVPF